MPEYYQQSVIEPTREDFDTQLRSVYSHRRRSHEEWVKGHQEKQKINPNDSRVRAEILVSEAWRLEKQHLDHQLTHATAETALQKKEEHRRPANVRPLPTSTPKRTATADGDLEDTPMPKACACLVQPVQKRLTAKYRSLALLRRRFESDSLEDALQTLRQAYNNDHEMLDDLIYRYGPEQESVAPDLHLRCVEERAASCDARWLSIGRAVRAEFARGDAFATVIRNLSIMRIFLEGSQASSYGCDTSERARRDAYHQSVLDRLIEQGTLFLDDESVDFDENVTEGGDFGHEEEEEEDFAEEVRAKHRQMAVSDARRPF